MARVRLGDGHLAPGGSSGIRAGDPNFRRYVSNDPGNATDPTGLQEDKALERVLEIQGRRTYYARKLGITEEKLAMMQSLEKNTNLKTKEKADKLNMSVAKYSSVLEKLAHLETTLDPKLNVLDILKKTFETQISNIGFQRMLDKETDPRKWSSPGKVDTGLTVIRIAHTPQG